MAEQRQCLFQSPRRKKRSILTSCSLTSIMGCGAHTPASNSTNAVKLQAEDEMKSVSSPLSRSLLLRGSFSTNPAVFMILIVFDTCYGLFSALLRAGWQGDGLLCLCCRYDGACFQNVPVAMLLRASALACRHLDGFTVESRVPNKDRIWWCSVDRNFSCSCRERVFSSQTHMVSHNYP